MKHKTSSKKSLARAYKTHKGAMYLSTAENFFSSGVGKGQKGKISLIFTSPPFPLNRKKKYGNLQGIEYVNWFKSFAPLFRTFLKRNGSVVLELGNAWEPGEPVMSTLALEALLGFLKAGNLKLCQQFVCYNPARLPSPAQWVNIDRVRVKDSYTHVWWMSSTSHPKADNRRILKEYSASMKKLLATGKYNSGKRPSEHHIGETSFLKDNKGAIPSNVLVLSNTGANDGYQKYCKEKGYQPHPARMPVELAEFFIKFLTEPGDLVLDPFAGSNTTGAAAEALGRKWIAIEPNKEYAIASKGRFLYNR